MASSPSDIVLSIPVEPLAVQSARFFRCGRKIKSFQPEKVTSFKQIVRIYARKQLPENFRIFDAPVAVEADFVFPPTKSLRKRELEKIAEGEIVYKSTRPDVDNLTKATFDALTGILWKDDARVTDYRVRKIYGGTAEIRIRISPF